MDYSSLMNSLSGLGSLMIIVVLVIFVAVLVPFIFYLISLMKALNALPDGKRPFAGGLVWLSLIPVLGQIWLLVAIILTSLALGKELKERGLKGDGGLMIAIIFIVCLVLGYALTNAVSILASLLSLAGFVCWIIHWVQIAGSKNQLVGAPKA